jgi:hypothetical protein
MRNFSAPPLPTALHTLRAPGKRGGILHVAYDIRLFIRPAIKDSLKISIS